MRGVIGEEGVVEEAVETGEKWKVGRVDELSSVSVVSWDGK